MKTLNVRLITGRGTSAAALNTVHVKSGPQVSLYFEATSYLSTDKMSRT